MSRESGQHLLHYRLVEKIGEGGMGSVWRAQDTTLDREAAVKILPDALAGDALFLARFEREAKLLASLNHPNLASVFGVHDVDSTRFLAMELVPGEDLSQRLQRGPLPVDEIAPILGRIADALEAAHKRGVVHRDLKPANVRLTPDGHVKVLDFGLAKATPADPSDDSGSTPSADLQLTSTGVVLGTAPYMSPEQARGRPIDARTDIWAFGCVLWECLTGERAFHGGSVPDLIVAILNDEPDWKKLPAGTPPSLVRLLRRCLAKAPGERLHHIADARIELEEAAAEHRGGATSPANAARQPARRPFVVPLSVAVAVAAVAALVVVLSGTGSGAPAPRERVLANARFKKLTDFPGDELDAAISADGFFVAFLSDREGRLDAHVGRIAGEYVNVSRGIEFRAEKWLPGRSVRRIGFHASGDRIWLGGSPDHRLRLIPLIGSTTKSWLPVNTIHVDWSPDGSRVLHSSGTGGDPVFLADANGANSREIPLPTEDGYHQHFPTWSPDGRWIYLARGSETTGQFDLWRVRPDGTGLEQLTDGPRHVAYPTPIDARTVLFIAEEPNGAGPWLWELDVETRVCRRATFGVRVYSSLSASRDGKRLVATVCDPSVGLWTVPIRENGVATEADVQAHPLAAVRALAPRLRNDTLFYLSSIGGGDGLWRYRDGESEEIWKGSDRMQLEHPAAISPDGRRVALVAREGRCVRLYVMNADGTDIRQRMDDVAVTGSPCWSPDGEWVAAGGSRDGRKGLFKVHVRDGRTERLHAAEATRPVWSPDGSRIVFAGAQVGPWVHLLAVTPAGTQLDFPTIRVLAQGERARFLPDGSGLVYLRGLDPNCEFRLLDFASGQSRPLTKLDSSSTMRTFDITPDGKTIVFDRQDDNSDIVLIERHAAD